MVYPSVTLALFLPFNHITYLMHIQMWSMPNLKRRSLQAGSSVHLQNRHSTTCAPLALVWFPKWMESGEPYFTSLQQIFHSVNDHINKKDFPVHYSSVDNAVALVSQYGQDALMAKIDLKAAFRLIPVQAADWVHLGICWRGQFYVDTCLPFGLRSAPALLNHYAEALDWIMASNSLSSKGVLLSLKGHMSGGNVQDADSM